MSDFRQGLGDLNEKVGQRLSALDRDRVIRRIWDGDHTVWSPDPTEITRPNRLGWLDVAADMLAQAPALQAFAEEVAAEGIETLVLMGMGGSSLNAEVIDSILPRRPGFPALRYILDTTSPDEIAAVEREIDLTKALFIVASKSGTTVETMSQYAYFWEKLPQGRNYVAITDAGTPLAALAQERGFRRLFLNRDDIGGRYAGLSYFGLTPAALAGAEVEQLLRRAQPMIDSCRQERAEGNPGAVLGALLGEAALAGRDKLTLVLPEALARLGDWIEQVIAESTGKGGKGIIPVAGEALGAAEVYGEDRLFVAYGDAPGLDALEVAGHPVVRLPLIDPYDLGGEFFRWEFAVAVAGHVLAINPFDQPDVQAAKEAAERSLSGGATTSETSGDPAATLAQVRPGDYIVIQAYIARDEAVRSRLAALRLRLRDRFRVATTVGFGPRYLHSTGQLHKGGPDSAVVFQIVGDDAVDLPIPGRPLTFGALRRAQAQGDFEALRARGRRAVRTTLEALEAAGN